MKKNVLIVNFNTQKLTEACIKSVNKHTPGCHIYVFDNSDKESFVNNFDNVEVIDNTKGQIIDFDEWLENYPNRKRSGGKTNNWGSAKHAYTVDTAMGDIKKSFILLDSDVLLKKDISPLFNEEYIYSAEVVLQPNSKIYRVVPYICFINNKQCQKNDIHYFNDEYMHGLRKTLKGDMYDTGAYFYLSCEKYPHKEIKCDDYIEHYKAGSWTSEADKARKTKHKSVDEWLQKYKNLWCDADEENETPVAEQKPKPTAEQKTKPTYTKVKMEGRPNSPKYNHNKRMMRIEQWKKR